MMLFFINTIHETSLNQSTKSWVHLPCFSMNRKFYSRFFSFFFLFLFLCKGNIIVSTLTCTDHITNMGIMLRNFLEYNIGRFMVSWSQKCLIHPTSMQQNNHKQHSWGTRKKKTTETLNRLREKRKHGLRHTSGNLERYKYTQQSHTLSKFCERSANLCHFHRHLEENRDIAAKVKCPCLFWLPRKGPGQTSSVRTLLMQFYKIPIHLYAKLMSTRLAGSGTNIKMNREKKKSLEKA